MALPIGTPRPCKGCGKTILKLKFCTNECRVDWYDRTAADRERARNAAKGIRSLRERYPHGHLTLVTRKCEHCDQDFTRRKRPKDAARFCSKACAGARRTAEKKGPVPKVRLCTCGQPAPEGRYKHDECLTRYRDGKPCRDCGQTTDKWQQRCEACRERAEQRNKANAKVRSKTYESYRRGKRAYKAKRRALIAGVNAESLDPFEVFERDKWRCHLCGCKTPKRLRGSYKPNAPELDHVIPLAAGGEHSRLNTACACRQCNSRKADKPLGQLRLVA